MERLQQQQEGNWGLLDELADKRWQGQQQNRQEFESKAKVRGDSFLEHARGRIEGVQRGFDSYAACLQEVRRAAQKEDRMALPDLAERLRQATHNLFEDLDAYAGFYFSWGENQSPLVTMIRQAVESHSRSALQSSQAQRILADMHEHLSSQSENKEDKGKAGEA